MQSFRALKRLGGLVLLVISFPTLVDSETTIPLSFSPGDDSIIPFTAAFNNAFFNSNISFDAGIHKAAGPEIGTLNKTFPFSSSTWVGIGIDNFELNFDIAFGLLSSGNGTNNLTYPVASQQLAEITEDGLSFALTAKLDLYAEIESKLETKFSTGFNVKMLSPAGMILQYPTLKSLSPVPVPELFSSGLNGNNFAITPLFNTTDPNPEFVFKLAIRTELVLQVEGVTILQLNLDLPAYTINATQFMDVNYKCAPAKSTPVDQTFSNLTYVSGDITTDATWQLGIVGGGFGNAEPIFGPIDLANVTSQCLAFSPVLEAQVAAPKYVSDLGSVTSLTTAAQPTKHISNGGAVGITFAVEILIAALVAGIFWFWKSRRSRQDHVSDRHSGMKKGVVLGFLAGIGVAIAGFFKRKHRERETYSNEYAAPTYLPRSTPEKGSGYREWETKTPILTTIPTDDFAETIRFAPIAPLADFDSAISAEVDSIRPSRQDEPIQAHQAHQAQDDAISAVSSLSAQPPPQSRKNPVTKVYDEIPWEEPRAGPVSPPSRRLFRKSLPGRKSY